jgi:hypothetical protein
MKEINLSLVKKIIWLMFLTMATLFVNFQTQNNAKAQSVPIILKIQNQPNAPIQISSAVITSNSPLNPGYSYVLTNITAKPISSFAIKTDVLFGKDIPSTGVSFTNLPEIELLLQPSSSKSEFFEGNVKYSAPVKEITFTLDFVEFADGSTWGPDNYKYTDYLAGRKEGGKALTNYFKDKINRGEINLVFDGINNRQAIPISVRKDDSRYPARWKEGFESGIRLVRSRLKGANKKAGIEGIKMELDKPFDALEGRRKL